jgi:hypothetical protein
MVNPVGARVWVKDAVDGWTREGTITRVLYHEGKPEWYIIQVDGREGSTERSHLELVMGLFGLL